MQLGALFGIEGAHALDGELANLDALDALGLRVVGLTHFFDNPMAGSAHGLEKGGLSEAGRRLVTSMNELGIVVDLVHINDIGMFDTDPALPQRSFQTRRLAQRRSPLFGLLRRTTRALRRMHPCETSPRKGRAGSRR